jgi:hypothetical protein
MNCYIITIILILLLYFCIKNYNNIVENFECRVPEFRPEVWNIKKNKIREFNNCYSYAMGDLKLNKKKKQQPGVLCSTMKPLKKKNYSCSKMIKRVQCDYPDTYILSNDNEKCECDYYKVGLFLDKKDPNRDYHFYKEHNNFWSHKPGKTKVTNLDADGKIIKNPTDANRKYKKYNYAESCGYLCKKYKKI